MKIKITEEQYNTLLNEGFFDRLGAKVSAGTKQIKGVGSNIKNIVTGDGKITSYQGIKNLGDETKLKSIGGSVDNKIKNSINDLYNLYPTPKIEVIDYLHFLNDFLTQNDYFLSLKLKGNTLNYTGKNEKSSSKEIVKLKNKGLEINKNIENSIKDLERLFSSAGRNKKNSLVEKAYKYMYFLKEFLGVNEKMLGINESSFSKDTNLFFKKKTNQPQPNQGVQTKQTPNQTQPTQGVQTNYPNRSEELRQKMQSRLNPNPYYGK
jgi:hypothetical protein